MKNVIKVIALTLVLAMSLVMLVSCGDKSGAIKSAFEKEGYTVESIKADNEDAKDLLELLFDDEQMEKIAQYEILLCKKDGLTNIGKTAIVIKFPSADDIKSMLTDEDGKTESYDEAVEDGAINGNCLIITLSEDSAKIFKEA